MKLIPQLRKFFTVVLLTVVLLTSTGFSQMTQTALAENRGTNEISNVKGESKDINGSYHQLRDATQEYRQEFENGRRNGQREFLNSSSNSSKKAVKNVGENTRNALERGADAVKETLNLD